MSVSQVLGHIEEVRKLGPPRKAPGPGKRVKLSDESYSIVCSVSEGLPSDHKFKTRYYVRRKKHVLCMCLTWESLCKHMRWKL